MKTILTTITFLTLTFTVSCATLNIPEGYEGAESQCSTQSCVDKYVKRLQSMRGLSQEQILLYYQGQKDYYKMWVTPKPQTVVIEHK